MLGRADALEGGDALALEVAHLQLAGRMLLAVHDHRAGPALPRPAAEARRLQVEVGAQDVEQRRGGLDAEAAGLAVDRELDVPEQRVLRRSAA
jgi:hypothetical protein